MKMNDEELLSFLQKKETAAAAYVWGQLGREREDAMREYHRLPYGNEEDGWSQIVTSDVQDTVEWILPSMLKIFTSTDRAVSFEPVTANDVKGAEQATDACNYVFYKQNNGFLTLHTAFKDALMVRNCAVMWRKETKETVSNVPFKGATAEMLAMITQDGSEIVEANEETMQLPDGTPVLVYSGRLKKVEERTIVKIEAFSPEDLLIDREWTSPLLDECPYVARVMRVTASDLKQMGFDVLAEELRGSDVSGASQRISRITQDDDTATMERDDAGHDPLAEGWLRIEFVLVDVDGDGIAERRCIYRLVDKVLKNEIVSHVPIATFSPVLNAHRWDGMSVADAVSDLQKLHTELVRQTLNNLYLSNNPRTTVLTDANWSPRANIDDLLDSRPGGVVRMQQSDALGVHGTPFTAQSTLPMLEYVQGMRENRTGVTRYSQGLDGDSLNKTASGINQIMTAGQQRLELIARVAAECLLKPIFQGILKLLTEGGMEKIAFRLRDEFVEYDPNEWRDWYDMTINVGLGTGDKQSQMGALQMIAANQVQLMQMGLVKPEQIYHAQAKLIEAAGFKDVQNFITDPSGQPPPPPAPNPMLQVEQMKLQAKAQEVQFRAQQDMQTLQMTAQMQDQQHQREMQRDMEVERNKQEMQARDSQFQAQLDAQREAQRLQLEEASKQADRELEKYKADLQAGVQLQIATMSKQTESPVETDDNDNSMQALVSAMSAPKEVVRDALGRVVGIRQITPV